METNFKPEPVKVENELGYIKLMKNETSKGLVSYSWDIKVVEGKDPKPIEVLVELLKDLNAKLMEKFVGVYGN